MHLPSYLSIYFSICMKKWADLLVAPLEPRPTAPWPLCRGYLPATSSVSTSCASKKSCPAMSSWDGPRLQRVEASTGRPGTLWGDIAGDTCDTCDMQSCSGHQMLGFNTEFEDDLDADTVEYSEHQYFNNFTQKLCHKSFTVSISNCTNWCQVLMLNSLDTPSRRTPCTRRKLKKYCG